MGGTYKALLNTRYPKANDYVNYSLSIAHHIGTMAYVFTFKFKSPLTLYV